MKTYEVVIDRNGSNSYVWGRISGIIYMLTDMPEIEMGWGKDENAVMLPFKATEKQADAIHELLTKMYPKWYVGMKEIE